MRVVLVAVLLLLPGCGPSPTALPRGQAEPLTVMDEQGLFRVELELPKATYAAGEPIEGVGRLLFAGPGTIGVAGPAGGLINFSLLEVDGPRDVGSAQDAACASYTLDSTSPLTSELRKSGGYSADDPNQDFAEAFLNDPVYRLPAGTWEIEAFSEFLAEGCTPPTMRLSAAIEIVVTD
jgi:hypothetical protein